MTPSPVPESAGLRDAVARLRAARRVVVSSHERPDGDAIGSGMALVLALRGLGLDARMAMCDVPPHYLRPFPGVAELWVATAISETFDAAVIMECSSLERTGVTGLDRSPVVNIDHHPGNTRYGVVNWIDESAAACGEMVYALVEALGAPLTAEIATHLYLAILTDTGSFRFSHLTPRTYEIAGRCVAAGADPQWIARTHYDSNSMGRVRLFGAVLSAMTVDPTGRIATLAITPAIAAAAGGSYDDTEGLINFPLSVQEVQAVAFFKETATPGDWRVSLRSKGATDVAAIAKARGGGGHANAAGCGARGTLEQVRAEFLAALDLAVARAS
ncbi:MAG: bifunctional oligoribonuclease/PAP phosphatase NrnA [Vicinamibacterales bacterium]